MSGESVFNPGSADPSGSDWDDIVDLDDSVSWDILNDVGAEIHAPNNPDVVVGDVPLPEYSPLVVGVVNQDQDLATKARFAGENRLAERINSETGIKGIVNRIWSGGIARSYLRQKYINEARREILDAQSLMLDYNDDERRRYNGDICMAFVDRVDGIIDETKGDSRKSLLEECPELHSEIKDIIQRYARGDISDTETAKREFNEAIVRLEEGRFAGGEHLSATNITSIAIEAKRRYENMLTVAEAAGGQLEHQDAIARVMVGFDVLYGQRQMDRLTPNYNKVDRLAEKIQNSKLGCLASAETIGMATGAAASVASFFGKRLTSTALIAVPGLGATIFKGMQTGADFEQERARAKYDARYGREFDSGQSRREGMMNAIHEHVDAMEFRDELNVLIDRIRQTSANYENHEGGASESTNEQQNDPRDELLNALARCKYYLEHEKTGDSFLRYSSELNAPVEQLRLIQQFERTKDFLRQSGISDLDERLSEHADLMERITSELDDQITQANSAARMEKISRIAKEMGKTLVLGGSLGIIGQEITAAVSPDIGGLFDGNSDQAERLTLCRRLANVLSGSQNNSNSFEIGARYSLDISEAGANLSSLDASDLSVDANGETIIPSTLQEWLGHFTGIANNVEDAAGVPEFVQASDGTYTLVQDGQELATGIDWNAETGELTAKSLETLRSQGISIDTTESFSQNLQENIGSVTTREVSLGEFYENASENSTTDLTKVKRMFWYDNDTVISDGNELKCYNYTDSVTGEHGLVTDMLETSTHNGKSIDFLEKAQEGKIKLYISPSQETQSMPIEVTGIILPNGQLAFVPEEGSLAANFFDADGNFIGKYAEIAEDLGVDENGVQMIAPLATEVGEGYDGMLTLIEDSSTTTNNILNVPQYILSVSPALTMGGKTLEFPMIFPFSPSGAMNASRASNESSSESRGSRRGYGYDGYGYGYDSGYYERRDNESGEGNALGEISPRIHEGKALKLGEEIAWYMEQLKQKSDEGYVDKIKESVERSAELKSMDDSIKTVVTIPVHAPTEYDNIYKTLSLYAQQENVDPDSFMVFLDMNWRTQEKGTAWEIQDRIRRTYAEVERARRDFPHLKIATMEQVGHSGIGEVCRVMNDTVLMSISEAIKSGRMSEHNDVLIVRNDADMKHMNKNYISSYQRSMQDNPKTPLFTGTTWFNIDRQRMAPGFGAVLTIERMSNLLGALDGSIHTAGGNFAYRATHFAAINGYGFKADGAAGWEGAGSDDLNVGYRIEDAFFDIYNHRGDKSGNPADNDLMDPFTRMLVRVGGASVDTDDNRYLKYYATDDDAVTIDAYGSQGYNQNVLRPEDIAGFSEDITNRQRFNAVVEQFEREMSVSLSLDGEGGMWRLHRLLQWWFRAPVDDLYTVVKTGHPWRDISSMEAYEFKLTDIGKEKFKQSLLRRMGDGVSANDRNSMQRAISSGEWLSPIT